MRAHGHAMRKILPRNIIQISRTEGRFADKSSSFPPFSPVSRLQKSTTREPSREFETPRKTVQRIRFAFGTNAIRQLKEEKCRREIDQRRTLPSIT